MELGDVSKSYIDDSLDLDNKLDESKDEAFPQRYNQKSPITKITEVDPALEDTKRVSKPETPLREGEIELEFDDEDENG